ncbi:MAG: hypothetical protein V4597_04675 [Pseudomonadota bacterium]
MAYAEDLLETTLVVFGKARDLGSDGQESLFTVGTEASGRPVVQAKHTSRFEPLTASGFAGELEKLPGLAAQGFGAYLLITNHQISGDTAATLAKQALAAGFATFEIHGRDQLERRIRGSATLRAMVPRLYGIGDLSQILEGRLIDQTEVLLAAAKPDLERFVATDAYRASVRALTDEGVIVLLGAPAAGKSTIAKALSVAAIDTFGATPLMLPSLERLEQHWNPREPARLYWVDDLFGATQARPMAIDDFNRLTPILNAALAQGCRFVFTSRTYIWRSVRAQLKLSATPQLDRAIVEIKVEDYSPRDRAQILYNHVKQGDQSPAWRKRFKQWAPRVAEHPQFSPEVARRFGLAAFAGHLDPTLHAIDTFVSNPGKYLEEVIGGLPSAAQAALALILMSGGAVPISATRDELNALVCEAYGVSPTEVVREMKALEDAFTTRGVEDEEPVWRFRHPTIGEAVATVAAGSPALLDVYLKGASVRRILEEAVCAGVEIEGAIIEIGASRYDALITRLQAGPFLESRLLRWFLIAKATPEFRRRYFGQPVAFDHPLIRFDWDTRAQVLAMLAALKDDDLLEPDCLERTRKRIRDGILQNGVADYLSGWSRTLVGPTEFDELVEAAVELLRNGASDYLDYWTPTGDERRENSPHDAFRGLTDFVERLEEVIDPELAAELLETIKEQINERAESIQSELDEEDSWHRQEEEYYRTQNPASSGRQTAPPRAPRAGFADQNPASTADIFSDIDD